MDKKSKKKVRIPDFAGTSHIKRAASLVGYRLRSSPCVGVP